MLRGAFLTLALAAAPAAAQCVDPPSLFRVGATQPSTTIQAALVLAEAYALANPGTVPQVLVDPGTYAGPITFPAGVDIVLRGNRFDPCGQVITGTPGSGSTITVSGGQTTATVIEGFDIRGGGGAIFGDVMSIVSASPTVQWNIISNGFAGLQGGGIFASVSSPVIRRNVFHTNFTNGDGGGIALLGCTALVEENQFVGEAKTCLDWGGVFANICDFIGGAIASLNGDASTIQGNLIRQNRARAGAGIGVLDSSPTIHGNRILENGIWDEVDFGGGINLENSAACVTSNVIAYNGRIGGEDCAAALEGGGVYIDGGTPTLLNNTIYGNLTLGNLWDQSRGGGVYLTAGANALLINNLVWGNTADIDPQIGTGFATSSQSSNCIEGGGAPFDFDCLDPGLIDPAGFDFHLTYGSELRDAGEDVTSICAESTDFEGDPRSVAFDGGMAFRDIGADEYDTHAYYVGDVITPTSSEGTVRVIDAPGLLTGLYYSALLLSPGFEVPVGPFGDVWLLGLNTVLECDFDPLIVETPVFATYADAGGAFKTTNADGYSEWATPILPTPLACAFTVYFQGLIQVPPGALRATNAEALPLQ
ncbi:MAG: right-handed parallel beta-helix repeat-containing protein [Planctomycetota bacterium]